MNECTSECLHRHVSELLRLGDGRCIFYGLVHSIPRETLRQDVRHVENECAPEDEDDPQPLMHFEHRVVRDERGNFVVRFVDSRPYEHPFLKCRRHLSILSSTVFSIFVLHATFIELGLCCMVLTVMSVFLKLLVKSRPWECGGSEGALGTPLKCPKSHTIRKHF
ncbi:hypothetical protein PMAYCL1PPCAC_16402 [Pristionchus mayeri]|uniref:Uncharacterized protein n=1 Tax=Pristionchus mayeri TaxID=1317129 RepID=A0AAN5CKS0_9BILA|nr:hypothetical protein PMAYCL1PPCAC_16402 [Pristionchus mayeri]